MSIADAWGYGLSRPHHDGSALYVSDPAPGIGSTVTVRVRVPRAAGFTEVHLRSTRDGEHYYPPTRVEQVGDHETWWTADLTLTRAITTYRWVLTGGPHEYAVLNAAGLWPREVPDGSDFRLTAYPLAPDWIRDGVVYQIVPDRFARSSAAADREPPDWAVPARWDDPVDIDRDVMGRQFYGGDLDGIIDHLDHLDHLGVDVIYLTPFFPARSNHRYDATTFATVDPLLGGPTALERLCTAAAERGIRVIGDVTTNHTGVAHEWFTAAVADPDAPTRDRYFIHESGAYDTWLGVPSLPKLNWDSPSLREAFCGEDGVIRTWLRAGLSGWRIDVANMTGRHGEQDHNLDVARWVREAAVAERADAYLVAEHFYDYSPDLPGDGWHGVMNYSGFTKPVWTWLRRHGLDEPFLGSPARMPARPAEDVVATIVDFTSRVNWSVLCGSWNLIGSHDTTRLRTLVGADPGRVEVAAGMLMTLPATPMLTYGDEIGMAGEFGEDGRRPMPWSERDWDERTLELYASLISIRKASVALRHGGLRFLHAEGDAIVYLREHPDETVLVHLARDAHEPVRLPTEAFPGVARARTLHGPEADLGDPTQMVLSATGPALRILSWPTATGSRPPWQESS